VVGHFTQHSDGEHRAYFAEQQQSSNLEFWSRFGVVPQVDGKRALEVGCGHGALSVELAELGAQMLGVDLDGARIDWAQRNVGDLAEFACVDVTEIEGEFDFIVSKDTFEHVVDVRGMLGHLRELLSPGGQIWVGFSPLYASPWGDHRRAGLGVPWGHVLLPSRIVYAAASRRQGKKIRSLDDLELNGMTPQMFRDCVEQASLRFESVRYNQGAKLLLRPLNALRTVPALEPLATVSIYAILMRTDDPSELKASDTGR
jgi:SAM-dependent methyltransferase